MLDHLSLGVSNLRRSVAFYDAVLASLGYIRLWSDDTAAGYGLPGQTDEPFAIKQETEGAVATPRRLHIAFAASAREAVRQFHATALTHGASDDGEPGVHTEYGAGYFAAFVVDPDGYRLEAVLHEPNTRLLEADDAAFAWMLDKPETTHLGLRLPPQIDRDVARHVRALVQRLRQRGCNDNWMMVAGNEVVGLCGFKNPPADSDVEIGYNVWPARQRHGHATRAVAEMIALAKDNTDIVALVAETSVDNLASQRALETNGFQSAGTRNDPEDGEVIRWRLKLR